MWCGSGAESALVPAQAESPNSSVRFALQNGSDSDGGTPPASTQGAKLRRALSRTTIAPEGFPTEPPDVAAAAPDAGNANGDADHTQQATAPGSAAATGPVLLQLPASSADAPAHAAGGGDGRSVRRDVLAGLAAAGAAAAGDGHAGPQAGGTGSPDCDPSNGPTPSAASEQAAGDRSPRGGAPGGAAPHVALPHDVPEGVQRGLVEPASGARGPAHELDPQPNSAGTGLRPVEAPGTPPPVEPHGAAQGFGDPALDPALYPAPGPSLAEAPGTPPPPPPPARGVRVRGMISAPHAAAGWCVPSLSAASLTVDLSYGRDGVGLYSKLTNTL